MNLYPLVVDLDGTLIHTDMLHESALRVLRDSPLYTLHIPYWLSRGKAALKQNLANRSDFDPSSLPYNKELLEWLRQQKALGRKLVLCTASDLSIATAISEHLGVFDEVMASDGVRNLAGKHKAELLVQCFGHAGFDYAGNSNADLAVWQQAHKAVVVNASDALIKKASAYCEVERVFPSPALEFKVWRRVFRVHQWLKNLLLFVPILAAHQLTNPDIWLELILAFFSFSLCASSVYIANDLLDLESDRQHPRKCKRPFASGLVPAWMGVVLAPVLLFSSLALARHVGEAFFSWLLFYFALTCAYSWMLKRVMLIDCLTLAMLYTLRIVAGAAAVEMSLSFWLLAFSVFLFLSLAFVKRYAELEVQLLHGKQKAHGRGYYTSDASLLQTMGITSGYAAVLVLALYLNSDAILKLYRTPEWVWGAVPIMLFWVSWMWMQAHRGKMHDDPLVFAVKDKASLLSGVAFSIVLAIGTLGWPW
ncbi:UbiA family prenyltransferase [Methylosarcina fibrata]|uniref:UbiA family prenyltransferase n=1 Tax=Methylosarcina fibrata TaxID=105972 RepID=UPI000475EAAE|nr:UbiA family prenyltransferase [Methylosarcina fibrata]